MDAKAGIKLAYWRSGKMLQDHGKKPILNSNDHISKTVDILGLKPYIPQQRMIKSDLMREKSVRRSMGDIPGKKKKKKNCMN